jgi:uncharacterized OsmC-like protein
MTKISPSYTMDHLAPVVEPTSGLSLSIRQYCDHEQVVDFRMPGVAVLGLDERPPEGHGWGPSPAHLLGSALGACLGSALVRCLRETNVELVDLHTDVHASFRNDTFGHPHLANIGVRLEPVLASDEAVAFIPSPERVAARSMIADSLRPDIGLRVAIAPTVRSTMRAPVRDAVRLAMDVPRADNAIR